MVALSAVSLLAIMGIGGPALAAGVIEAPRPKPIPRPGPVISRLSVAPRDLCAHGAVVCHGTSPVASFRLTQDPCCIENFQTARIKGRVERLRRGRTPLRVRSFSFTARRGANQRRLLLRHLSAGRYRVVLTAHANGVNSDARHADIRVHACG